MAPISQSGSTSQGFEGPISSVGLGLCGFTLSGSASPYCELKQSAILSA